MFKEKIQSFDLFDEIIIFAVGVFVALIATLVPYIIIWLFDWFLPVLEDITFKSIWSLLLLPSYYCARIQMK